LIILQLLLSMAAILAMAYLFNLSVEMLGDRIGISQGGVGSVLAALSTVLPKTIIFIIAILGAVFTCRDPESAVDISIEASVDASFLVATLAMFLIGISLVGFRRCRTYGNSASFDEAVARRDLKFFIAFLLLPPPPP
jgi:cation:H+ antiporter